MDQILRGMAKDFDGLYAKTGRPSVPPERLLRAVLLQIFYSVRSERMLIEQMNYDLLFRWFRGVGVGRASLESCRVQQEPGSSAEPGSGAGVLPSGVGGSETALV